MRQVLPLQIAVHDIAPYQVVGAQRSEGERQLLARQDAAAADGRLAQRHRAFIDQEADVAGIGKVEHRCQQREARELVLTARRQHRRRAAHDRATDTEAERIDLRHLRDIAHHVDGLQRALREVVVPCELADFRYGAAP